MNSLRAGGDLNRCSSDGGSAAAAAIAYSPACERRGDRGVRPFLLEPRQRRHRIARRANAGSACPRGAATVSPHSGARGQGSCRRSCAPFLCRGLRPGLYDGAASAAQKLVRRPSTEPGSSQLVVNRNFSPPQGEAVCCAGLRLPGSGLDFEQKVRKETKKTMGKPGRRRYGRSIPVSFHNNSWRIRFVPVGARPTTNRVRVSLVNHKRQGHSRKRCNRRINVPSLCAVPCASVPSVVDSVF